VENAIFNCTSMKLGEFYCFDFPSVSPAQCTIICCVKISAKAGIHYILGSVESLFKDNCFNVICHEMQAEGRESWSQVFSTQRREGRKDDCGFALDKAIQGKE
jgi:hypothetical protein